MAMEKSKMYVDKVLNLLLILAGYLLFQENPEFEQKLNDKTNHD